MESGWEEDTNGKMGRWLADELMDGRWMMDKWLGRKMDRRMGGRKKRKNE